MGSEGPYDNILKIRPPLTIESEDIDYILEVWIRVLEMRLNPDVIIPTTQPIV